MSIYNRKNIDFSKTLQIGQDGEWKIIKHFIEKGYFVKRVDYKKFEYDIQIINGSNKSFNIEVKTHKGYSKEGNEFHTFYAEVIQNTDINSVPEYLTSDNIDYIIHISTYRKEAYIFDHKKYKDYILKNKDKAIAAKYATSSGITIPWNSKAAGHVGSIKI